ncbi:MAG: hypothetical protein ACRC33_21540 [Gemmataceae bacterium]
MYSHGRRGWLGASALAVAAAFALLPGAAGAQGVDGDIIPAVVRDAGPPRGNEVQQVGCASCGGGILAASPSLGELGYGGGCSSCGKKDSCTACGPEQCYAGKKPCDCCWEPTTHVGAVIKGVYNCICCNDPCYEPKWIGLANNSFLLDSPRPVTHMKLGADYGWDLRFPDKGETFTKKGTLNLRKTDYMDAYLYNEAAPTPGFGFFIYMPIRHVDPVNPEISGGSGFGDMVIGTKSVILDCELLLATFMFKTFLPTGNSAKGVGTGHVSLEPSMTSALKLTPYSYLQSQLGFRFPLGGDSNFQGSMPYGGLSYNHLLWNCGKDIELIGNLEMTVACLANGKYTDEFGIEQRARDLGTFVTAGPGIRLIVCQKVDVGISTSFPLTQESAFGNLLRAEFRWRF